MNAILDIQTKEDRFDHFPREDNNIEVPENIIVQKNKINSARNGSISSSSSAKRK